MLAYVTHLRKNNEQHKLKHDSLSCHPFALSTLQVPRSIWIGVVVTQANSACRDISILNLVIETRARMAVPICQFRSRGVVWNLSTQPLSFFMTHDSQTELLVFLLFCDMCSHADHAITSSQRVPSIGTRCCRTE